MARPKLTIDYGRVKELAEIQCTQEEVAVTLGISERTLQRNAEFCRLYYLHKQAGKIDLLKKQFEMAKKGDKQLLIWLGKQYLGQTDKSDSNITGNSVGIIWADDFGEGTKGEAAKDNVKPLHKAV
jgi:hypothetical protein